MNYRHAYHAGNFADVLKHAVLARVIEYLKQKPAPFRVIDTHAGVGLYDLEAAEAIKTGEWKSGIGRLLDNPLPADIAALLAPYLDVVRGFNGQGPAIRYPGSPLIARRLLRDCDSLVVNELHPVDHERLEELFARDKQTKVLGLDGWTALKALLPPKERRGVVLVDPPFEEPGELTRLLKAIDDAVARFASGTLILWYPIKDVAVTRAFETAIGQKSLPKVLAIELLIRAPVNSDILNGTGMVVVNPPYMLAAEIEKLSNFLAQTLAQGRGAACRTVWLGASD